MSAKSKSYAEQISNAKVMGTALMANLDELTKRGMSREFIAELEAKVSLTITKNSEQEKLKAELKMATAAIDSMLAEIGEAMSEATKVVKLSLPQEQWKEFGITAKR